MIKTPKSDAKYDPVATDSKGMQKTPEFDAKYDFYYSIVTSNYTVTFIVNDSASLHRLIKSNKNIFNNFSPEYWCSVHIIFQRLNSLSRNHLTQKW